MSEDATLPSDGAVEAAPESAPAPVPATALATPVAEPSVATVSVRATPAMLPTDAHALLEIVRRGLAPDADESARAAAREVCGQAMHARATAPPVASAAPVTPDPSPMPPVPMMPGAPLLTSPIAMATRALRQLPPDQLLELLLQRLRAALPRGASVPAPKGIQFQLVPMTPPSGSR